MEAFTTEHIAFRKRRPRGIALILLSMLPVLLLGCPNPVNDGGSSSSGSGEIAVTLNATETTKGSGTNEVQRISSPGASGGSFRLSFDNGTLAPATGDLYVDATVGEVQAALEQLRSVDGASNVFVTGADGGPWDVEFTGALAAAEQREITVDGTALILSLPQVTEITPGGGGRNEVQLISSTNANGGTFTLEFDYNGVQATTFNIGIDATPAYIDIALEALFDIAGDRVAVTGPAGGPWQVEFAGGGLEETDVPLLGVDGSNLTGNPVVSEEISHAPGDNEVQTIEFSPAAGGGEFTLGFGGETTPRIPYDATAAVVESALQELSSVPQNSVSVTSTAATGGPWEVEFTGRLAATDHELLSGDTSELVPAAAGQ